MLSVQHPQHETIHTWIHFLIGSASSLLVLNLLMLLIAHVTSQHDQYTLYWLLGQQLFQTHHFVDGVTLKQE